MSRRKTDAEFKKEAYEKLGNEYVILDKYIGAKHKVRVRHLVCNTVHWMLPSNILRGATCLYCSDKQKGKKQRKSPSRFKKEFNKLVGAEYTLLSNYISMDRKIKVRHNKCNYEYWVKAGSFMQGVRCPKCNGGVKKTPAQFEKEFNQLSKGEYTLLSTYKSSHAKIKVRHNKCNYEYWVEAGSFMQGRRCPKCSHRIKITTDIFKKQVYDVVGDEFTVLGEYQGNHKKILLKHNICNRVVSIRPSDFLLGGQRCKWCYQHSSSHGNDYIARILKKYGIKFTREYKFDGCKDKRKLPFDFYLQGLNTCIEYDGKQHTDKSTIYYSKDVVRHDHIKDKFCKDNGIRLIRIPYTVRDIKDIEKFLMVWGILDQNTQTTHYIGE